VSGLDLRDTITYTVLTQSLLMVMSAFGNRELSDAIVKGDIVSDMSRPVNFYGLWAGLEFGRAFYYLLFRGLPTFVFGLLLFGARLPATAVQAVLFGLALVMGVASSFAFRFILNSLAFWTNDARGVMYASNTAVIFLSGMLVPLNFLPDGVRAVLELLPFRAMAHLPVGIYLGKVEGAALVEAIFVQLGWVLLMVLVGRFMVSRMMRKLVIHGG
jgi:ABC-2 type transport system permease protein